MTYGFAQKKYIKKEKNIRNGCTQKSAFLFIQNLGGGEMM